MNNYLTLCLLGLPVSVFGAFTVDPVEFITLSPFIVETSHYNSQFEASGLSGMGGATPFRTPVSVSEELDWAIGVTLQRRGLHSVEPNIQGMGLDRIVTTLNGVYLPNAAPTRTSSPINYFGSTGQLSINVIRSLPSVVHGPVPTGSRILIESIDGSSEPLLARASVDSNLGERSATATMRQWIKRQPLSLGLHYTENGDYEGGSGKTVDADYRAYGVQFNGMVYAGDRNATTLTAHYFKQDLSRNASLPLDTKDTPSYTGTLNHSVNLENGVLSLRAGYTKTEPYLTSEDRTTSASSPVDRVEARGEVSSYTLGLNRVWDAFVPVIIEAGIDCTVQDRLMKRSRFLKNGNLFDDLIWPDMESVHAGAFLEIREPSWQSPFQWRLGLRMGTSRSGANKLDHVVRGVPGAAGGTIRENFVAFHGEKAASTDRDDSTGSANLMLEWRGEERLTLHGGLGYTVATPGLGERYRSFVNALGGGVEMGNPTLHPEKKAEAHLEATWQGEWYTFSASGFYAHIDEFVQRGIIVEDPLVYSFKNRDARFYGACGAMELTFFRNVSDLLDQDGLLSELSMPLSFSVTRGEDVESGLRLAEVPPLEATAGLRLFKDVSGRIDSFWMTVMARYVASQTNPQPELVPVYGDTEDSILVDLELAFVLSQRWSLDFGIANLFDETANSYLQPPVATGLIGPSSGNLNGGDRIPLPGRSFRLSVRFEY